MNFDIAINNGTVIDGTGQPRFRASVGILDGKIAAITPGGSLAGRQTLDAAGQIVAPGFVDIHSHADWVLPVPDHDQILAPLLLQGVTTLVTGNCGFSPAPVTENSWPLLTNFSEMLRSGTISNRWRSTSEYLDVLEQDGVLFNTAFLVGHGTLRYAAMGDRANSSAPPTPQEMDTMRTLTRQALQEGAFGFSTGLAYAPCVFASNEELAPLLRTTAEQGGIFTVHGRAYTWVSPFYTPMIVGTPHNVRSNRELLDLARQAGVRLQLSHLIFVGRRTWRTHRTVLRDVERAAAGGLDVAFDAFPYTVGNTTISVVFPAWFLDGLNENIDDPRALKKLNRDISLLRATLGIGYSDITLLWACAPELAELEGLNFGAIARRLKMGEFEAYMHIARESGGKARVLLGTYSGDGQREDPLQAALAHPLCAFATDTILARQGRHNPASFGTFPRILGRYSRDLGLFSLEQAIHRMTAFSADRIGLEGVGRIVEGGWADLVLFDPVTVADNTAPDRSDVPPTGIRAVLISGHIVAQDGRLVDQKRRGRVLRRS